MDERTLQEILTDKYGIESPSLEFLREGGTHTYVVNGKGKFLLKVISSAFSDTAMQSVSIMRYLEGCGFPVPKTILTKDGDAIFLAGTVTGICIEEIFLKVRMERSTLSTLIRSAVRPSCLISW